MFTHEKTTIERADEIYKAKIATGKYSHYDEQALKHLYSDCLTQCAIMDSVNNRRATA